MLTVIRMEYKIDISKDDKKIISGLVERVYGYRCSIAHAKGDVEEYIAIPSISKEKNICRNTSSKIFSV